MQSGAGQHIADLTLSQIEGYLKVSLILAALTLPFKLNYWIQLACLLYKATDDESNAQGNYFSALAYNTTMCLVKLCLIVQNLRIFLGNWTRRVCWLTFGFVLAFSIATFIAQVFTCRPISGYWDITDTTAECFNKHALVYTHSGLSIATDFAVLVIPITALRALKMSSRDKVAAIVLLSCGSFGCIVSVVRLYELWWLINVTDDPTYHEFRNIWSVIELTTFIVCASVTGLKPFYEAVVQPVLEKICSRKRATTSPISSMPSWKRSREEAQNKNRSRFRMSTLRSSQSRMGAIGAGSSTRPSETSTGARHTDEEDLRRLGTSSTVGGHSQQSEDNSTSGRTNVAVVGYIV